MNAPAALRLHAKYSASSAHRWMRCAGSIREAERAPPEIESEYAKDGTDAHTLLTFCLENGYRDAVEGAIMTDGLHDKDRTDAVQIGLDYAFNLLDAYEDAELIIERQVNFPSTVAPNDAYGFIDIGILIRSLKILYVIDYKHGIGEPVEVEDNEQCMYYGEALCNEVQDIETAVLVVIQPRCPHWKGVIRERVITRDELEQFVYAVDEAILKTQDPNAPLVPGKKQCRWCPARLTCPAVEAQALAITGTTFANVQHVEQSKLPPPESLTPEQLAHVMRSSDLLKIWANKAEDYAYQLMKSGTHIPGFKLVEANPRRKWYGKEVDIAPKLAALAEQPEEIVFPKTLISITEATSLVQKAFKEKAARGKKKEAAELANKALALLTIKDSSGNLKVVEESDSRPAHNAAQAAFQTVQLPTGETQ